MKMGSLSVAVCLVVILYLCFQTRAMDNKIPIRWEKEVVDDILTNYSTTYRPVRNNRRALVVAFDMQLRKLVKLEIKEQVLTATVFISLEWFDPQLRWDEIKYNGTTAVNLEPSQVWTPDVVLYNTADDEVRAHTDLYKTRLRVHSSGKVNWVSALLLKSSCSVDILWFPFDEQKCSLTFGSWSYPLSQLVMKFKSQPRGKDDIRKSRFTVDSGEWIFNSLSVINEDQLYPCCPQAFSTISYTLFLTRRPGYYLLYLILPCISLSGLFILAFFIPHLSGERIGYGVTMLLNMSVYLLVISDRLPEKSDKSPLIGILYVMYFYVMSMGLVASVCTNYFAYKKTDPPSWLKRRFLTSKQPTSISTDPLSNNFDEEEISLEAIPKADTDTNKADLTVRNRRQSQNRKKRDLSGESSKDIEEVNTEMWIEIAGKIDRLLSLCFAILVILFPLIVILAFYIASR